MPRPPREDIAAPPFPPGSPWIGAGSSEPVMERLTARGPVLVQFFDFAQVGSARTAPYLREWHRRYGPHGLGVVGAHVARFPFGEDPDAVEAGLERLGIDHPVIIDERRALWTDYGCKGWPSLFLWARGGVLRWYHFGEGEYGATEEAIRSELGGADLVEPLGPIRPEDEPGAEPIAPTPELLPGGSERRPWSATDAEPLLEIDFEAGGAYATLAGRGKVGVRLDGDSQPPLIVEDPGLYSLTPEDPQHRHGRLELRPELGVLVYSVSFSAGIAS